MDYGILSIIPAVLAIVLAMITKNIVISLAISVFVGSTIICGWNPIAGFLEMTHTHIFTALSEPSNMQALFMMVIISGFIALLTSSGGAGAFTNLVTKKVNTRSKCEGGIWLGGLFVWFTDTGNSLIVGPIFEALAEKLRVSREKFAYILDCTTSPICSMIPIIGWGVTTISLIQAELDNAAITDVSGMDVFIQAIPFNYYAILTLFMAGLLAFTQWDYGPMLKAQNRAMKTGKTLREGGVPMRSESASDKEAKKDGKVSTMVIPLITLLVVLFAYLFSKDFLHTRVAGSDLRTGIASAFFAATIVLVIMCLKDKLYTFTECINIYTKGCSNAMFMCIVLVLAWSLSSVTSTLNTAGYLIKISSGFLAPSMLPLVMFILGAIMSFATGTSWGTMGVLMPLEKAARYQKDYGLSEYDASQLTQSRHLAELFEKTADLCGNPKKAANWFLGETLRLLKERGLEEEEVEFSPEHLAALIASVEKGEVNNQGAKEVFEKIFDEDVEPMAYIEAHGLKISQSAGEAEAVVDKILAANADAVEKYKNGEEKVLGFLVGQIMKEMKGKCNPGQMKELIISKVK